MPSAQRFPIDPSLRHVVPTAALGGAAAAVAGLLTSLVGMGATTALAVAAICAGVLGRLLALRIGAPAIVLVVPAMSPMLPGLRIFRGMYEAVSGNVVGSTAASNNSAVATMIGAAGIALAISAGSVLGDVVSAPFDRRARGLRRRSHLR